MTEDAERAERAEAHQTVLEQFSRELSEMRVAQEVSEAEVWDLWPDERQGSEGVTLLFQTASGSTFTKYLPMPPDYKPFHDLVRLLEYTGVDPANLHDTEDGLLGERVPIKRQRGAWLLDWEAMDRATAVEAADVAGELEGPSGGPPGRL